MKPLRFLLPLVLATAACSSGATNFGGNDDERPTLVLRIAYEGGFVPFEYTLRGLPLLSVYSDGQIIVEGPQIEIYPPPAVAGLFTRTITSAGIEQIRRAAEDAGLTGPNVRYEYNLVADASDSVFTYVESDGTRHEIRAYALGLDGGNEPSEQMSADDRAARMKLAAFQEKMTDLDTWLGAEVSSESTFVPAGLLVFSTAYTAPEDASLGTQAERTWPIATPLNTFGDPHPDSEYRCGVVSGADLDALNAELEGTNTLTPWISGDAKFALVVRPALPDETTCPVAA